MGMISSWIGALTSPKATFAEEKKNASFGNGIKNLLVVSLIYMLIYGGIMAFMAYALGSMAPYGSSAIYGISTFIIAAILIAIPIFLIIGCFISFGIIHLFAKLLGGKGSFAELFYLLSIVTTAGSIITGILFIPMYIPIIGIFVLFLMIPVSLYLIYVQICAIAEAHQFSLLRAFGALILPAIIMLILFAILMLPMLWYTGVFNPSKFRGGTEGGGFGAFTFSDSSVSAYSTQLILGNSVGRAITLKSATLSGSGAPTNCIATDNYGSQSAQIAPNGIFKITCGGSSLEPGDAYSWQVSITYTDSQSGLTKIDSGGFIRGQVS